MNALDLAYLPIAALTAPFWARKQRSGWSERFGRITPVPSRPGQNRILIHAVSVGEVSALRHLIPLLTPHAHIIISVGTDTGITRARELFSTTCDIVRYPLDASWAVRRFLDAVRPDAVALVELELWPNFIRACNNRKIPVCIINGRLSARSFKGYSRLRFFFRPLFSSLKFAAVQDADYAKRFEHMGVAPNDCLITGSMKWDAAKIEDSVSGAPHLAAELGLSRDIPLIVAGSTGPGEEALLHAAVSAVEKDLGPIQLLCAPRKPERFNEAAQALGPGCTRRSAKEPAPRGTTRFLLDTIGELRAAYSLADLVIVGRSFGDLFGSDPIEPIALGKPTIIGPAVSDFAQIVGAFESARGIARATRESLPALFRQLLSDPAARHRLAHNGREVITRMQGASSRHAELLLHLAAITPQSPEHARIS